MKSALAIIVVAGLSFFSSANATEVTYDAHGRVTTVDDVAFIYANVNDHFASHMWTPETGGWVSMRPVSKRTLICKGEATDKTTPKCTGGGMFVADGPLAGAGIGFGNAAPGEITYYNGGTIGFSTPGPARQGSIGDNSGGVNPAYSNSSVWYVQQQQAQHNAYCAQMSASYASVCAFAGALAGSVNGAAGAITGSACGYGVVLMAQGCLNGN